MSMLGNVAIAAYIDTLLALIENNQHKPADELLKLLVEHMKQDKKAADDGWL